MLYAEQFGLELRQKETFKPCVWRWRHRCRSSISLRSLARLWQASDDSSLPAAVATVLGLSPAEAAALLRTAGEPAA